MAKLIKTASGKQTIKISKAQWENVGLKAGWMKKQAYSEVGPAYDMNSKGGAGEGDPNYGNEYSKNEDDIKLFNNLFLQKNEQGHVVNHKVLT